MEKKGINKEPNKKNNIFEFITQDAVLTLSGKEKVGVLLVVIWIGALYADILGCGYHITLPYEQEQEQMDPEKQEQIDLEKQIQQSILAIL